MDMIIFDKALSYCLENSMLSMTNLNDSYRYFLNEGKEKISLSKVLFEKIRNNEIKVLGNVEVSKPDLNLYNAIIPANGGVNDEIV